MVSDFISKVKHVIGSRFSGYRLGSSRMKLDLGSLDLEIGLSTVNGFFQDTIYISCEIAFGTFDLYT
jgi:hypothetical protein